MTFDLEASLKTITEEINKRDISVRLKLFNGFAHRMIAASVGLIDTKEADYLRKLPSLIIGALKAKDIPYTNENIKEALELVIDRVAIEYNLHPVEYVPPENELDYKEGTPTKLRPETLNKIMEEFSKIQSGELTQHDKIKEAVVSAIRNELNLSKDVNDSDVLHEANRVLTKSVGQIIDEFYPGATQNPEHPIWDKTLLSCILLRIEEIAFEDSLKCVPKTLETRPPKQGLEPRIT